MTFQAPIPRTGHFVKETAVHSDDQNPTSSASGARRFFGELRERGVVKMIAWYTASALVTIQIVQTVQQAFYLSPLILTASVVMALGGFPIAILLSWHFDLTPGGLQRDVVSPAAARTKSAGDWKVLSASVLGVVAVLGVAFWVSPARSLMSDRRQPRILCAGGAIAPCRAETTMDANRFVVLPLTHDNAVEPGLLNGEICARLIGDGLSQWQDMKIADPLRLTEALARLTPQLRMRIPVDSGFAIARELGAGKLIMGRLVQHGDSTRVEAILYDAQQGELLNRVVATFAAGAGGAAAEFSRLARKLVVQHGSLNIGGAAAYATNSYAALFAYDSAWQSIGAWKLADANRYFRTALFYDAKFTYARLWLAHVMLWQSDSSARWLPHAQKARADSLHLDAESAVLARALAALGEERYQDACKDYRAVLARDSANFHAWFGLGECLSRNSRVVRDSGSASGWSFESSYASAIRAHQRALELVPAFNEVFVNLASSRLGSVLFLYANGYRSGTNDAHAAFAAFPALVADTTAFVPYPIPQWRKLPRPATQQALLERNRFELRKASEGWAAAYPRNARALEALAYALEHTGEIVEHEHGNSALSVLDAARSMEKDDARRARMDIAKVRLLVKAGEFKKARKLAKGLLRHERARDAQEAYQLSGMAGLLGRPAQMGRLLAATAPSLEYDRPRTGESVTISLDLARTTSLLLAYAYAGTAVDSSRLLLRRAHATLDREPDSAKRSLLHEATLDRAARMLFFTVEADEVYRGRRELPPLMNLQRMLLDHQDSAVRDSLRHLLDDQRSLRPADIAADGVLLQTQLLLAVGDSVAAAQLADDYLHNLQDMAASHFRQAYQPVTVVRLMMLRAELAARAHDATTAKKWSRAVIDLWSDGERETRPMLRRMRQLAHLR